jgi:hypothetical protein
MGLMDFETGLCFVCFPATPDPLEDAFPEKPEAWRTLDVALIQHLIVEEICEPALNGGNPGQVGLPALDRRGARDRQGPGDGRRGRRRASPSSR